MPDWGWVVLARTTDLVILTFTAEPVLRIVSVYWALGHQAFGLLKILLGALLLASFCVNFLSALASAFTSLFSSSESSANSSSSYSSTVAHPCSLLSAIVINFCLSDNNLSPSSIAIIVFSTATGVASKADLNFSNLPLTYSLKWYCTSRRLLQLYSFHQMLVGSFSFLRELRSNTLVQYTCPFYPPGAWWTEPRATFGLWHGEMIALEWGW